MKKIIKKFWGVAFVVVLLSTLLVGAIPQAAAGQLSFTYANLPGGLIGGVAANLQSITSPGTTILDYAVAQDGLTIYAATTGAVFKQYKSLNAGRSWIPLFIAVGFVPTFVAVAPDNPNIVAYVDQAAFKVAISKNGGVSFSVSDALQSRAGTAAANVTDVAIAPQAVVEGNLGSLVAVSGSNGTGATLYYYLMNYTGEFSVWKEAMDDAPINGANINATADTAFNTVAFSPAFSGSWVAYLTGDDAAHNVFFHVLSFNSLRFDTGIGAFPLYNAANTKLVTTAAHSVDRANIVFDPGYVAVDETTRLVYFSLSYVLNTAGAIFRVSDNAGPLISANLAPGAVSIWSIALNSSGTVLVAAAGASSATWTMQTPASPLAFFVASRVVKRSGGGNIDGISTTTDFQTIAFASTGVVLARGSTSGAFALSIDNGYTFNDISMVNAILTNIDAHAVAPDGVQRYVVTDDAAQTSVFYWDGTYWERTLTLNNVDGFVAKASPNNFSILYVADKTTGIIRYTATAGTVNWLQRTSPVPVTALVDIEVQDDTSLWVATNVAAGGAVTRLTNTGYEWPVGPPYYNVLFAGSTVSSLTLVGPDKVIAGGANGRIAYTNGGVVWVTTLPALNFASPAYATATDLATGSIIYATTSNAADGAIYLWTIGSSVQWGSFGTAFPVYTNPTIGGPAAAHASTGIFIYDGCLYYSAANVTNTSIARAFLPAFNLPDLGEFATVTDIAHVGNAAPDSLQFSTDPALPGNKLWYTDSLGVAGLDQ
ncbi:MAG: hypothetical protein ACYDG5_06445, partial [Dehalococcoidales bacterium]